MPISIPRFPFPSFLFPVRRSGAIKASARACERQPAASASGCTRASAVAETRGAAMRRLFPMLFIQAASPVEWARSLEVHSYLEHAANLTDLEQRIRAVEHRRHFNGS